MSITKINHISILGLLLVFIASYSQPGLSQQYKPKHGHHGAGHNTMSMPGLRGENASAEESDEIRLLFRHFDTINREVENLPNGIRTITWSTKPEVMDVLVSHSVGMIDRVKRKDDPKIMIQSPTLDSFFLYGDQITSEITVENNRLIITQTSNNADLVKALQTHAAEVSAMADRGMHAVHEMMMKQNRGH